MATLRDRNKPIPGGFKFLQPETNWSPPAWSSFSTIVSALISHRRGNMYLVRKHNWALDPNAVAFELDAYNAKIAEAHGWDEFIVDATPDPPKLIPPLIDDSVAGFAGGARKTAAAVQLVWNWLGSGLKPVEIALAEKRATTCVTCPKHVKEEDRTLFQRIGAAAADNLKRIVEIKNDLKLRTSRDAELGTCSVCDCAVKVKGLVELKHIVATMDAATMDKMPEDCWIMTEQLEP